MYKPFIWEIILCETLSYAMTYPSFESFLMYGFIHVPQMNLPVVFWRLFIPEVKHDCIWADVLLISILG